jgi:hypothetical protein
MNFISRIHWPDKSALRFHVKMLLTSNMNLSWYNSVTCTRQETLFYIAFYKAFLGIWMKASILDSFLYR